jgi:hypothetical protein
LDGGLIPAKAKSDLLRPAEVEQKMLEKRSIKEKHE